MSDKRQQLSILDQWASQSGQISRSTERLNEIAEWIDWTPLYAVGRQVDKTGPQGGQPRKPVRWMIRGSFLQHLYQLSDPQLEDQPTRRLSFRRFTGLSLDQKVPDFTTLWRFREQLAEEGLVRELFNQIIRQLEDKGLILKRGTVVDATIINSGNRPLSDNDRKALAQNPSAQIDPDADSTQLEELLSGDERAVFGDKAYPSKDVKIAYREQGVYYDILDKAYRNTPMSPSQKARNARKRRVRRYVEHPFAAIKNRCGGRVAKAKTKLRNKARFVMAAICWNIERSISWAKKKPKVLPARAG